MSFLRFINLETWNKQLSFKGAQIALGIMVATAVSSGIALYFSNKNQSTSLPSTLAERSIEQTASYLFLDQSLELRVNNAPEEEATFRLDAPNNEAIQTELNVEGAQSSDQGPEWTIGDTTPSSLNLNSLQPNADHLSWEQSLELWVNNAPEGERDDRLNAADRIRRCYSTGSKNLDLSELRITSLLGVVLPPNLETLDLIYCQISSLEGVVFPPNLLCLFIDHTPISSLEGVVFPPNLKHLNLSNTQISSVEGVEFPPNLATLELRNTQITSLEGVVFPPNLTTLYLSCTQISSLVGVVFPPNLATLELRNTQITSLEGVVFPPNLTTLNLSCTQISSLLGVVFSPNLQELNLSYAPISSLEGVVLPQNLQKLDLSYAPISSLEGVVFPPNLRVLDLCYTLISSLEGVVFPSNLLCLFINHTPISSLEGVVFPPNLLVLNLSCTQITSLVGVEFPPNLHSLDLSDTQISSVEGLLFPPNLQSLHLGNTRISSLPERLAQYSDRLWMNTTNCRLNAAANEAFQNAINRARAQNSNRGPQWATSVYEEYLPRYSTSSSLNLNSFQVPDLDFDEDQKNLFNQFLIKVQGTKDFQNGRTSPNLLLTLKEILQATTSSSTFKENLFPLINESLDSCSDRTAITLNRIDLQRRIDCGGINPELLIGYRRLQLLQEAASKFIQQKGLGDAIEPMLYLQIKLKEDLNLPIVTSSMLYEGLANITDEELEQTKKDILSKTTTGEQIFYLLLEKQEETYDDKGRLEAVGDLSPTNPFLADISKIWEKQLKSAFSIDFERIVPDENEDTTDQSVIQKWDNRMKELVRDLTQQILLEMALC